MISKLHLLALLTLSFAGCATNKPRIVRSTDIPGTFLTSEQVENVRASENVKAYPIGRYIDPNNPGVMHERHPVYRVESTAKWNLRPTKPSAVPLGPGVRLIDSAEKQTFQRDELYLELNRQKEVTTKILAGTAGLNQQLEVFARTIKDGQEIGFRELRSELGQTQKRLDALETFRAAEIGTP